MTATLLRGCVYGSLVLWVGLVFGVVIGVVMAAFWTVWHHLRNIERRIREDQHRLERFNREERTWRG